MTTTDVLKSGAGALAGTAAGAVTDLAEKAKSQAESVVGEAKDRLSGEQRTSHRGRTLLLGLALVGAVGAAFRYLTRSRRGADEQVIDLTQDPVTAPESMPTT